ATGPRRAELVGSPRGQKWEPWEGSQTLPRRGPAEQSSSVPHAGKNGNRGRVPKPSRDGAPPSRARRFPTRAKMGTVGGFPNPPATGPRRAELVGSPRGQKWEPWE